MPRVPTLVPPRMSEYLKEPQSDMSCKCRRLTALCIVSFVSIGRLAGFSIAPTPLASCVRNLALPQTFDHLCVVKTRTVLIRTRKCSPRLPQTRDGRAAPGTQHQNDTMSRMQANDPIGTTAACYESPSCVHSFLQRCDIYSKHLLSC